ncbi:four helix bundle protein [Alicyclobacillus mengziensis]|uniref:Four helix bundle protein n=1 Tax=Alicyclobacillus mengziensis TaxID=2931921 RepID=A0A9X7W1I7_9BACL|nr:four helix bundle protein [Alicyclobacillus mengziensis]QSO48492.1 four helix bundle protein [Alicyclobacillus mengziensis]
MNKIDTGDFIERDFRKLIVYRKAVELCVAIYKLTKNYPKSETYGLVSQGQRSSSSVPLILSEANSFSMFPKKELSMYANALGSLQETRSFLELSLEVDYIDKSTQQALEKQAQEIHRLLIGMIKRVQLRIEEQSAIAPHSRKRTLDKQKLSSYSGAKQEGSRVNDDDFEFEVAVLQWIEQSKADRIKLISEEDQIRMLTNDEGRFLPDVPREEGRWRYRWRK